MEVVGLSIPLRRVLRSISWVRCNGRSLSLSKMSLERAVAVVMEGMMMLMGDL